MGGILTTLIGYYFGSRGSNIALKQVEKIKEDNEKLQANLSSLAPTNEEQDSEIEEIVIN